MGVSLVAAVFEIATTSTAAMVIGFDCIQGSSVDRLRTDGGWPRKRRPILFPAILIRLKNRTGGLFRSWFDRLTTNGTTSNRLS